MAKRDVELIISAENKAKSALEEVAAALNTLKKAQEEVAASGEKTGGALDRLGSDLETLKAKATALEAFAKVAAQLDRASEAGQRLEANLNATMADLARLQGESERAAASTAKLTAAVNAAAEAEKKQQASVDVVKRALAAVAAELKKAERAYETLGVKVSTLKAPNEALSTQYKAQGAVLDGLRAKHAQLKATYDAEKATLDQTAATVAKYKEQIKQSEAAEKTAAAAIVKTTASIERQKEGLARASAAYTEMKNAATSVGAVLGGVAANQTAIGTAAKKAAADIAVLTQALNTQKTAAQATAIQGPAAAATQAYRTQAEAVARARQEMESLKVVTTALGAEMARAAQPSATLKQQFDLARVASANAKQEYVAQAQALKTLGGAAQGSFAQFDQAVQKQVQALAQIRAQLKAHDLAFSQSQAQSTAQVVASVRQQTQAQREAAASTRTLGQAVTQLGAAFRGAAGSTNVFRNAIKATTGETRTALGLYQRVRGQLLALSAGYAGVIGVMRGFGAVVDTMRQVEAAQNRLGAVFDQDKGKVAGEMQFLTAQADRLGIQFGVLSEQYSRFAVTAKAVKLSAEDTRKIFLSIAEAGRVNKLSLEEMNSLFLAFTQIMNKGKFTGEEVTRQLGNVLPGALQTLSDALGITAGQFIKMMDDGVAFAGRKELLQVADKLTEKYGAQLPEALQSTTTALGRLDNALFQARRAVIEGGFAVALKKLADQMTEFFKSKEGVQFFLSVGAAASSIMGIFTVLAKNIDLVIVAFKLLIVLKTATFFRNLYAEIVLLPGAFQKLVAATALLGTALRGMTAFAAAVPARMAGISLSFASMRAGATALATGALPLLSRAFSALAGAVGGIPGIIVSLALSFGLMKFLEMGTDVDTATEALAEHGRIMAAVGDAYDAQTGKVTDLGAALKATSLVEINAAFLQSKLAAQEAVTEFLKVDTTLSGLGDNAEGVDKETDAIKRLADEAKQGKITFEEFQKKLDEMSRRFTTSQAAVLAAEVRDLSNVVVVANNNSKQLADVGLQAFNSSLQEMQNPIVSAKDGLVAMGEAGTVAGNALAQASAGSDAFTNALDGAANAVGRVEQSVSGFGNAVVPALDSVGESAQETSGFFQDLLNAVVQLASDTLILNWPVNLIRDFRELILTISDLIKYMNELERAARAAASAARSAAAAKSSGGTAAQKNAAGGFIRGPGTGTSDSILSYLSNGEWVIKAAAVRKYGSAFFAALNSMKLPKQSRLPRFAEGGEVGGVGSLGSTLASLVAGSGASRGDTVRINLSLGGQTFNDLMAPREVADRLIKFAMGEQIRSGGQKPAWYLT